MKIHEKWNVGWGMVSACNMACEFCYSRSERIKGDDIELYKCIDFIDKNHEYINSINYGTGENSLSLEWFELVKYIRENYPEIKQAVTTNGYLGVRANESEELKNIILKSIDEIDISLDFADEKRHNKFRGCDHAYEWVVNTLKLCQNTDILLTLVFIGTDEVLNIGNLSALFEMGNIYGTKLRMNIYRPTGGINDLSKKFIASYSKIIDAIKWIDENHKVLALGDPLFCAILSDGHTEIDHSGKDSMRILHSGDITPSTYLISDGFKKTKLDNVDLNAIHIENSIPAKCNECEFRDRCGGGVIDRRILWYNDILERDPYCPFRKENYLPDFKVTLSDEGIESVHYGYLPTLFFKP